VSQVDVPQDLKPGDGALYLPAKVTAYGDLGHCVGSVKTLKLSIGSNRIAEFCYVQFLGRFVSMVIFAT
jgi:hypothetical protein